MPYLIRRHRPTVQPKGAYRLAPNVLAALIGGDPNPQRLTVLPPQGSLLNQREGVAYYNAAAAGSGTFGDVNAPLHTGSVTIFVMGWWMWGGTVSFRLGSSNGVAFAKQANNGRFTIQPAGYTFNPVTLNSYTFSANPTFRKIVGQWDLNAAEVRGWTDNGVSDSRAQSGGSYSIPASNTAPLSFGSSSLDRVQLAVIFAGIVSPWELFANPWGWVRPVQRARTYFFPSAGGGATIIDLTAASFGFTGNAHQPESQLTLTTASNDFTANTIQPKTSVNLAQAALNFTANAITVGGQTIIDLSQAAFNFTTNAVTLVKDTAIQLTTAAFNFVANAINISTPPVSGGGSGGGMFMSLAGFFKKRRYRQKIGKNE